MLDFLAALFQGAGDLGTGKKAKRSRADQWINLVVGLLVLIALVALLAAST